MHFVSICKANRVAFRYYVISGVGLDPTKPQPKKAKQMRLERKLAKRSQNVAVGDSESSPVSASTWLIAL